MNELVTLIRCFRYRLYPSPEIEIKLLEILTICRKLYNQMLHESNLAYDFGYKISSLVRSKCVPYWFQEWGVKDQIYSKCAQPVSDQYTRNLITLKAINDKAREEARKTGKKPRIGKLRFKSRNDFKSFCYNQSGPSNDKDFCDGYNWQKKYG